jgi:uncharacterized DUF497 family protein
MEIVWDEPKRVINLARGLDFADLTEEWFGAATIVPAKKGRLMAIGAFGGVTLAVIFKPLGTQGVSVISMRQASKKERRIL